MSVFLKPVSFSKASSLMLFDLFFKDCRIDNDSSTFPLFTKLPITLVEFNNSSSAFDNSTFFILLFLKFELYLKILVLNLKV